MSRIATTTEAVDALLEYSKLFVSASNELDKDAMDSIAESIAIVRNTVNDDVVCVTLDTPALAKAVDAATGLGCSYESSTSSRPTT